MQKFILAALATGMFATPALASDDDYCGKAPLDQWMSETALKEKATGMGYEVRSVKIEDGCYEAYAIDAKGVRMEIYFHPVTGDVVKSKIDD
jgi:hypothetical protein